MESTLKRLYVGGISPSMTKTELADRFGKFGKIDEVDIISRKDDQGNPIKTFAYLNINISDVELKKCISLLNKTKWKGGILKIEIAKESFLHRLSQERQEAIEKEKAKALRQKSDLVPPLQRIAVPGTEVPNHKNWVVSKFGRVLPVLHFNGKTHSKIMKYDPSKYCHNIKMIDDTFEDRPVSQLTWQIEGGDDEISRKRRGEFPNFKPPLKRIKKLRSLPICDANDTQTNQKIPLSSIQSNERQSETNTSLYNKKLGQLENRCINSMTDEYDSEEELQAVLKRERATRVNACYADDSNLEVVDDSFKLSYTTHWAKPKTASNIISSCNSLDDGEYDSADTDEIITVAKTVQKDCNNLKTTKPKCVRSEELKIQASTEKSTYAHGTKGERKSKDIEMSEGESDSEIDDSEEDSSDSYSDEEYKAMMQNCIQLDLTMGDLEMLAKDANDDEETAIDSEYETDLNSHGGYSVTENPLASGSEMLSPGKKQNARPESVGIKKKMKSENLQSRLLESDSIDSDCDEHYEHIHKNCSGDDKMEALMPKLPIAVQCLVNNHKLEKGAKGPKGETDKSGEDPGSEKVRKKRGLEPEDIVASILEDDCTDGRQSNNQKKDSPVKPPAFKGLSSVLASAATANLLFSSSSMSNVEAAAVTAISDDTNLGSYAIKQTKKVEKQDPSRDLKHTFREVKSKIRSSSSDTSDEYSSDLSCASSSAMKLAISPNDPKKVQVTPKVKQQQDNQKRLVAMMERRKERELQKQIIQGALLDLDLQGSKKSQHIVFDSESASENEADASTSVKKSVHDDDDVRLSISKFFNAKQSTSKLFYSSEEDSDNEDKEDNERFNIKAQYEGRSGLKLMKLQSRFGTDERFKMDSRFLESSSEDEEASDAHKSKVEEECDLSAEKKKTLGILQSILNINVKPQPTNKQTTKGKKFKDLNALHYDPAKEDHATFETKAEEKKESKSEKKKKRLEAEKLPDVSKETFHEINVDFSEVFGISKTQNTKDPETTWDQEIEPEKDADTSMSCQPFSFQNQNTEEPREFTFSFFGNTTEDSISNSEPYKTEAIKPSKVAWQEDPRFQDSSSEGEDDEKQATVATENKTRIQPDISAIRFFFFVKDDERLKTGPSLFSRSSNTEREEMPWEQRKDILLEECRKRHKDAKRKMKARN
ncbi:nucleolar protein 8 [Mantella aurantiaca]